MNNILTENGSAVLKIFPVFQDNPHFYPVLTLAMPDFMNFQRAFGSEIKQDIIILKKLTAMKWKTLLKKHRFLLILFSLLICSFSAVRAEETQGNEEIIRVGWYDSPFNLIDSHGRRSGYAYDYQQKIAAYTGWAYEYVEGTWPELLGMLERGEIDLLSDISYKPERSEKMLYSALPMGTESYYLYISSSSPDITMDQISSLSGKKIGVTAGSIQEDLFRHWADQHHVSVRLIETTTADADALAEVDSGKLDGFVTMDIYGDPEKYTPIYKIGSSDFFFAVRKDRPDLLAALDAALSRIQDENKYYNQELNEKYMANAGADLYLSTSEKDWLENHGPIRIGYQKNYLAFCDTDPSTGSLTGALKDYLAYAETCLENDTLSFETEGFDSTAEAVEALRRGTIDCLFPANLNSYESELLNLCMSPALMKTEMDAVVRQEDQKDFMRNSEVTAAVNLGNTNYEKFLAEHFPTWKAAYFKDTPAALQAVADRNADCILISNYRFSNISKLCESLHLTTLSTGVDMEYYFAVRRGDTELYSILSRVINGVPDSLTNAALNYYSTEVMKTSFLDLLKENMIPILAAVSLTLFLILILLLRNIRAEKKVQEGEILVSDLNRRVFVDELTSVRNRSAYQDYITDLQKKVDQKKCEEFAIGIFDCDDLKIINDRYGHDKGNIYLQCTSRLICRIFQHSPVFRIGGDEFAVILQYEDFQNRKELQLRLAEAEEKADAEAVNPWEKVRVSRGITEYDPKEDTSVMDTARRADRLMYEDKLRRKQNAR